MPGVPYEMQQMVDATTSSPTCSRRSGETAAIVSRSLKTWGTSESALAEMIAAPARRADGNPTIAFLASGIEGLVGAHHREGRDRGRGRALLDAEEAELRAILGELVFGVDDETMESAVLDVLRGARAGRSASPSRSPAA